MGLSGDVGRVWKVLKMLHVTLPSVSLSAFSYLVSVSFVKCIKSSNNKAV